MNHILHLKNTFGAALLTVALLILTCVPVHAQPTADQAAGTEQEFAVAAPDVADRVTCISTMRYRCVSFRKQSRPKQCRFNPIDMRPTKCEEGHDGMIDPHHAVRLHFSKACHPIFRQKSVWNHLQIRRHIFDSALF